MMPKAMAEMIKKIKMSFARLLFMENLCRLGHQPSYKYTLTILNVKGYSALQWVLGSIFTDFISVLRDFRVGNDQILTKCLPFGEIHYLADILTYDQELDQDPSRDV
jgi:hypothetical protein